MLSRKSRIASLIIFAVLVFSAYLPALAYAAPLANNGKDWQYVNGNSWAWNYSPQDQINKNNVNDLEVKWVFPVGSKTLAPAGLQTLMLNEGANTPPIVRNGVVYITTNFLKTYAVDAKNGKQIWTHDYTVDAAEAHKRLGLSSGLLTSHIHAIRYWENGDAILVGGMACDFYGIDAKTGKEKFRVPDLCSNVPGVVYQYTAIVNSIANIGTYEKGQQFIFALAGTDGTQWSKAPGRYVLMGIDMNTKNILWRVFGQPPHNALAKDWALEECDIGYLLDIPCKEVAAKNKAGLEWDWTPAPNQPAHPSAAVTASWGQPAVDEDTGIIYLNTGNQVPWTNLSLTHGPRLYGSATMAIDMNKGKRVWWLSHFPHDPYDYDCNWNGVLIDHQKLGKVYIKGCKEGILYVMDAATGKPKYKVDVVDEQYPGKKSYHLTDPLSYYDLREWNWPENSKYHGQPPIYIVPSWAHGTFGTDISYDGKDTLFHYAAFMVSKITRTLPLVEGGISGVDSSVVGPANTTIVARDVSTGKVKWTWFYPFSNQRAHMLITNDMVVSGFTDGNMRFFDKDTGSLLKQLSVGAPVITGVTAGSDKDGNQKIFVIAGATSFLGLFADPQYGNLGPTLPGTLMAIGLSEKTNAEVRTTTITTTSVTTASPQTITTTQERTTGLPVEITYAAVGIAVIAIIAAALLVLRKRA